MTLVSGAPVAWLILLNLRDRRSRWLNSVVQRALALPSLRGRYAVRIRCPLALRTLVVVEVLDGTPHEVWDIFSCLANVLPPRVTLQVHNIGDRLFTRPFMLQTVTRRWLARHVDSVLAGG